LIAVKEIMPGDRVSVFDHRLFVDDWATPLPITLRPATVVCRYGKRVFHPTSMEKPWIYPDLVDVEFDHRPGVVSKGHFTDGVRILETTDAIR
jgi:hypothetical protein